MNKPLALSLIIPAYNEEQHLKTCLDSVAKQTIMPDEVIVVDNNSTDDTRKIATSYPFVRVVREKNQGIVYARNAGFNAAKCGLIGRIDADSVLPANWVERVYEFYQTHDAENDCLTGGGQHYNVPLPRVGRWMLDVLAFRMNRIVLGHHFLFGSNMVIPKVVWKKVQNKVFIRNDIHEDVDIAIHAHRTGAKIIYKYDLVVGIKLRRIFTDHDKYWGVLMLWPQTLRAHSNPLWITGWFGAVVLYAITPLIYPLKGLQLLGSKLFR